MFRPRASSKRLHRHGFSLIEVTLVISILLSLTSVLFLGAQAFLKGTDRAMCIQTIATVQKAVRSYGNLHNLHSGATVSGLESEIIGPDKFLPVAPACPGDGTYTYGGDTLPAIGVLYLRCSVVDHVPIAHGAW